MKLSTKLLMLSSLFSLNIVTSSIAMAQTEGEASEATQNPEKSKKKKKKAADNRYYSSLGLGKTLPESFYRVRLFNRYTHGDRFIDDKGDAQDVGYELTAASSSLLVEYGLSEELSFQILVPYVTKNTVAFNGQHYRNSARYAKSKAYYENLLYQRLQASGQCASRADCEAFGKTTTPLAAGSDLVLPSGERVDFSGQAASSVLAALPSIMTKAVSPQDGSTGVGDIDFGMSYVAAANKFHILSVGFGLRLPTGQFEDVPSAQRPTGQGMMQGAVRLNYDFHATQALWLSWQHQAQTMLQEGKRRKSSSLDPNQLNEADPTTTEAIAAGSDGGGNLQTVRRKGFGHTGLLRADYGLGGWAAILQPISVESSLSYEFGAEEYIGDLQTAKPLQQFIANYGAKFDGLGLKKPFPGYVRIMRDRFLSGKNIPIAVSSVTLEFAYYLNF
ncbi:MAG: hypothetical protein EOP07_03240 [Proteobacteria bacterium]|nr:MAG: hypothetical protein EOP07_03240 [Pseudomonadota bacterium]